MSEKDTFLLCQYCGKLILANKLRCPLCNKVNPFKRSKQKRLDRPELRKEYEQCIDKILIAYDTMLACQIPEKFAETLELIKQRGAKKLIALIPDIEEAKKQERIETGVYLEHCHLSHYETHRLISIHDIERLKMGQALKGEK